MAFYSCRAFGCTRIKYAGFGRFGLTWGAFFGHTRHSTGYPCRILLHMAAVLGEETGQSLLENVSLLEWSSLYFTT